jgi:dUTPase
MLTEDALLQRLRSGEVEISYSFDPFTTPPEPLPPNSAVEPDNAESRATKIFERAFFGDRLGLTLGPLVLSHKYGWTRGRRRYKGRSGVFDLRETQQKIQIQPGESITVNSNEKVALGSHTGAITLPRLSHATAGLVLSPSYIDPYWNGILVLQMVNLSSRPFELTFGEKFAITRFYDLQGNPLPAHFRTRFAEKSHHYGLSWERVLTSDADPFPLRKQPVPSLLNRSDWTARELASRYGKALSVAGVSVAVLVTALLSIGRLQDRLDMLADLRQRQEAQTEQLQKATSELRELSQRQPRVGVATVMFPAGKDSAKLKVPLAGLSDSSRRFVFAAPTPNDTDVTVDADLGPESSGTAVLTIAARRPEALGSQRLLVQWIVA